MGGGVFPMATAAARPAGRSVHHVPGRLRLRLDRRELAPETLRQVEQKISAIDGVESCTASPRTGSLLVRYDPKRVDPSRVLGVLAVAGSADDGPAADDQPDAQHPHSKLARRLDGAYGALDRRVRRLTGHHLDLKMLMPIGFAAVAVRQIIVSSGNLMPIPWYVLLWYAYDSYTRAHRTTEGKVVQQLMKEAGNLEGGDGAAEGEAGADGGGGES